MTDLFNPNYNRPVQIRRHAKVNWAMLDFIQCQNRGHLPEIKNHIAAMDERSASNYAKYLIKMCKFPAEFFYDLPNTVLNID